MNKKNIPCKNCLVITICMNKFIRNYKNLECYVVYFLMKDCVLIREYIQNGEVCNGMQFKYVVKRYFEDICEIKKGIYKWRK